MIHFPASVRRRVNALVFPLIAILAVSALAQGTAKIEGSVLDVESKGIPGATVTVTQVATHAAQTVRSDASGLYAVDGLAAGTYTVTVSAPGFAEGTKSGVVLAEGQTARAPFTLSITTLVQQVEVNAGIDSIAAQTAPSGGFLEERPHSRSSPTPTSRTLPRRSRTMARSCRLFPARSQPAPMASVSGNPRPTSAVSPMATTTSISMAFPSTTPIRQPITPGPFSQASGLAVLTSTGAQARLLPSGLLLSAAASICFRSL